MQLSDLFVSRYDHSYNLVKVAQIGLTKLTSVTPSNLTESFERTPPGRHASLSIVTT